MVQDGKDVLSDSILVQLAIFLLFLKQQLLQWLLVQLGIISSHDISCV